MKIALITDLHFGAREGSIVILNHQRKFYEEVFFPYLKENNITHVVCLGDTFDKRKYTNNYVIDQCKEFFFIPLQANDIKLTMLVGNHCSFFKNTLFPNTPDLLLGEYTNICVINYAQTIDIGGTNIAMIPWICQDNHDACYEVIKNSPADICMGHLEIGGFKMYRGIESQGGMSSLIFSKYHKTFSGHYHHKSTKDNITYLGTPYEMTWQDYGDPKGFHIFDLGSRELTFIENPNKLFVRLEYDDKNRKPIDLDSIDISNTYVKLIIVNKTDFYNYDLFLSKLYTKGAIEIKIIEDIGDYSNGELKEDIQLEDTQSILSHYIDSIETNVDTTLLKSYIQSLHTEALNSEIA